MPYDSHAKDKSVTFRIPSELLDQVDAECNDPAGWTRRSRGDWIREAITAKLESAGESPPAGDQYISVKEALDNEDIRLDDPPAA